MNKKAIGMSTIAWFVLIIICGAILSFFFKDSIDFGNEYTNRQLCEKSIDASSNKLREEMNALFDPYGNSVELQCSTEYINYREKDPEKIKKIVANKMYDCWKMYKQGEKEIFETDDGGYCSVCSRLTFKHEVEVDNFLIFLTENYVPGQSITYWEHFMGKISFKEVIYPYYNEKLVNYDHFTTSEPLAIVFYMDKDAYPDAAKGVEHTKWVEAKKMGVVGTVVALVSGVVVCGSGWACPAVIAVFGGVAGTSGGYLIGSDRSADWDARIILINYEKLNELNCTRLESKSTPLEVIQK